jgi:alpha-beta hydrolase superfamily lysophospholipase
LTGQTFGLGRSLRWVAGCGVFVLLVLALVVTFDEPATPPPPRAMSDPASLSALADVPPVSYYRGRDGAKLAYRAYPGMGPAVAILIHGWARSSLAMHALARTLAEGGITTLAVDMRGHGDSASSGDIAYIGQLDDDLEALVAHVRKLFPAAPVVLVGHSHGAGFALHVAGGPLGERFAGCLLLAPYFGLDAVSTRPDAHAWADRAPFRIAGLTLLHRLGIDWFEQLPVVAFAIRPEARGRLPATYSYRLYENFRADQDFLGDFHRAKVPIVVIAGTEDELMFTERYKHALAAVSTPTRTLLVPKVGHLGIVSDPVALATVVAEARRLAIPGASKTP